MAKFKCILPVLHDGNEYGPDDEIELDDLPAKALLGCGAVGALAEPEEPEKPKKTGGKKAKEEGGADPGAGEPPASPDGAQA